MAASRYKIVNLRVEGYCWRCSLMGEWPSMVYGKEGRGLYKIETGVMGAGLAEVGWTKNRNGYSPVRYELANPPEFSLPLDLPYNVAYHRMKRALNRIAKRNTEKRP